MGKLQLQLFLKKSVSPFQSPSLSLVKTLHSWFIFTCSNLRSAFISFFPWIALQSAIGAEGGDSSLWDNENRRCTCVCVCCHFPFTQHEHGKRAETKKRHRERAMKGKHQMKQNAHKGHWYRKKEEIRKPLFELFRNRVNTTHLFNNRLG